MKIVTQPELAKMPNGTVFAEFAQECNPKYNNGDMEYYGLNVICGSCDGKYDNLGFNGVCHVLGDERCNNMQIELDDNGTDASCGVINDDGGDGRYNGFFETVDTCDYDYDEDSCFLIFEERDIKNLIRVLNWALDGCP